MATFARRDASARGNHEIIDLTGIGQISRPGQVEYSRLEAEAMQGRMIGSRHDQGAFGKIVGMTGFRESKFSKPFYALEVQWTRKPHQSVSDKSTLYRSEIGRFYPVLSGSQEKIAKRIWSHHHAQKQAANQNVSAGR